MSRLDYLFEDAAATSGDDLASFDRSAPPASWSASKSKSDFQAGRVGTQGWKQLPTGQAGPMGGGGSTGPALPFRIKETMYMPKATGASPLFTMAKPRPEEPQKADVISFTY
mmetsp:Transcript_45622/g.105388  ORF Transcript_45622/g.105388 Transcript_45622/m.105388 type:complete len:112 (-) Transcript_45622:73-408(-)